MNEKEILECLQLLTQQLGKFPTHAKLVELGESTLRNSIINSKIPISDYARKLGYKTTCRPMNYWNEDTLTNECVKVCKEVDGWPSRYQWNKEYTYLSTAIFKNGFTLKYFQNKLGITHLAAAPKKECLNCHEMFTPPITSNSTRQRFCSNECLVNHHRLRQNERNLANRQVPKICPICNVTFTPLRTTKQKYCARSCYIRFRKKLDKAVQTCLEFTDRPKETCIEQTLGYGPEQLLEHLKSHPRWQELQGTDWHLDHIFPIKAFVDHKIFDIKVICDLRNLQPLPASENLSKGTTYDIEAFKRWLNL